MINNATIFAENFVTPFFPKKQSVNKRIKQGIGWY